MKTRRGLLNGATAGQSGPTILDKYLTIVALEDGLTAKLSTNACEYCVDGDGNWKSLTVATNTESINTGQTLSFRGNLTPVKYGGIGTFTISKSCNLEGNCMSMLFGDDAVNNFSLSGKDYAFCKLFRSCSSIKSVSSGFLPATTLADSCYEYMFNWCMNLTTAPELPATTLASRCYISMFESCHSLTKAPELPATTLASYCYAGMFRECPLTTTPALPATTLAERCYAQMFFDCSSLTKAPSILPATTLVSGCYSDMFRYCNLNAAPELPATTLASDCYYYMFYGCSKLTYIKAMFTTTPSSTYTSNWVKGVASTGTFVKNKNATWNVTGPNGIPEGWTVQTA